MHERNTMPYKHEAVRVLTGTAGAADTSKAPSSPTSTTLAFVVSFSICFRFSSSSSRFWRSILYPHQHPTKNSMRPRWHTAFAKRHASPLPALLVLGFPGRLLLCLGLLDQC